MRKISITLVIALLLSTSLLAQKKKWGHFGLKTGMNYSTISTDNDNEDSKWNTGFVLGAFVKIPLNTKWAVQPEFLYSAMGGGLETGVPPTNNYRLNYFTIPVLFKYEFCKKWNLLFGPQVDFIIQAKQRSNNFTTDITTSVNEFGFDATGGVEFVPTRCINLGLRYIHGLNNAWDGDGADWKNRGFQLSIGFLLN